MLRKILPNFLTFNTKFMLSFINFPFSIFKGDRIIFLILRKSFEGVPIFTTILKIKAQGPEKLSNFPKVTQRANAKIVTPIWIPLRLCPLTTILQNMSICMYIVFLTLRLHLDAKEPGERTAEDLDWKDNVHTEVLEWAEGNGTQSNCKSLLA